MNFGWFRQKPAPLPTLTERVEEVAVALATVRNRQALAYWASRCRGDRLPARRDLRPEEMIPFLPNMMLLDVDRQRWDFYYRLVGTRIDHHMFQPLQGHWVSEFPHQREPSRLHRTLRETAQDGLPRVGQIPYVGPHRDFTRIEDLLLPLANDGQTTDMIMVVLEYLIQPEPYRPEIE